MGDRVDNHTKTGGEQRESKNKAGSGATLEAAPQIQTVFQELKVRRKHRYVTIKIGETLIDVEKIGERGASYESFKATLPFIDCRFVLYDQEYETVDRGTQHKLWFISWFPNNASTYNKMAYTAAKQKLVESMPGVQDTMVRTLEELDVNLGISTGEDEDSDIDL